MAKKIIKIPKGYEVQIWIQNKHPTRKSFYFANASLNIANDSDDFGQDQIKLVFKKCAYSRRR